MGINYTKITAMVQERYMPGFANNIFDKSALLSTMLKDQSVKVRGGSRITEGVLFAKPTAAGSYDGYDVVDTTPADVRDRARFEWAHKYVSVAIAQTDELQISGPDAVGDLVAAEMEAAEMKMRDQIAEDIFAGGATIIGLDSAVAAGTYAGIPGATSTWWQSGVDATAHTQANMKDSTHASYVLTLLQTAFRTCTHYGMKPNLVVTTLAVWDLIENVLQQNATYPKNVNARTKLIGDGGFNVLEFRGVPIIADEKCTANYLYVLNTQFLKFYIHPNNNFKFTGFKEPTNQLARVGQITLSCQLGVTNRRMFYKFTSLGAT